MMGAQDARGTEFPRWPTWEPEEGMEEHIFPVKHGEPDEPEDPTDYPTAAQLFTDHRGSFHVLVMWPKPIKFKGKLKLSNKVWFSASSYGGKEKGREATMEAAFQYFKDKRS